MKAYDACPKCRSIDRSKEWVQGETKIPYYVCVCKECGNLYYQTFRGQEAGKLHLNNSGLDTKTQVPIRTHEIITTKIDPVPYIPGPKQSPPCKQGKDTTSQARL